MTGEADGTALETAQLSVMLARAGLDTGGAFVLAIGTRLRPWVVAGNDALAAELRATHPRYFTDGSLEAGWFYFLLQPGTLYLAFGPGLGRPAVLMNIAPDPSRPHAVVTALAPEMLERARRLRVDVPLETPVVYAGTLHFRFEKTKAAVTGFAPDALHIRDETELARRETAQHIGALGPPRTLLVEPVESGPIILRTPRRDPTR